MWNKFLRDPLHIVKDYELRKLLWQSGGGTAVCKTTLRFYPAQSRGGGHSGLQKIFEVQRYRS